VDYERMAMRLLKKLKLVRKRHHGTQTGKSSFSEWVEREFRILRAANWFAGAEQILRFSLKPELSRVGQLLARSGNFFIRSGTRAKFDAILIGQEDLRKFVRTDWHFYFLGGGKIWLRLSATWASAALISGMTRADLQRLRWKRMGVLRIPVSFRIH